MRDVKTTASAIEDLISRRVVAAASGPHKDAQRKVGRAQPYFTSVFDTRPKVLRRADPVGLGLVALKQAGMPRAHGWQNHLRHDESNAPSF